MRAGELRHRVSIQAPVETQNTYGEPEISWSDIATGVQASIEPLRGREFFTARQEVGEVIARIKIRWRNDVTVEQRVVHGPTCACNATATEEFMIESALNIMDRQRELHLMCNAFVP